MAPPAPGTFSVFQETSPSLVRYVYPGGERRWLSWARAKGPVGCPVGLGSLPFGDSSLLVIPYTQCPLELRVPETFSFS